MLLDFTRFQQKWFGNLWATFWGANGLRKNHLGRKWVAPPVSALFFLSCLQN